MDTTEKKTEGGGDFSVEKTAEMAFDAAKQVHEQTGGISIPDPKTSAEEKDLTIIELPSGKTAKIEGFKNKHIIQATQVAGDNQHKILWSIIAQTVSIDGQKFLMEDWLEMDGMDGLAIMGHFGQNF